MSPATAGRPAHPPARRPARGFPHRGPDRRRSRLGAYGRLFAVPGSAAFTAANLVARLPMGMLTVAAVLMISEHHGSYALAGAVTAARLAATAVVAPLTARLVDRLGQARVLVPAVLVAACGELGLVACVVTDAVPWTLFACAVGAATVPNTGGMSRARWAYLYRDDPAARHTANALEQALDELCFMCGPVLAAVLCTALFPAAGTLAAVALLLAGSLTFAAQRRTEPPVPPREPGAARRSPVRLPGMPPLLATFACTGVVFGALEVVTIAFADGLGMKGWAGAVLAMQALGSALAGLLFGVLSLRGTVAGRFARCTGAMAVLMTLPLAATAAGSLPVLAPALLLAGMATAPTMVTGMTLVQRITPAARLNEGMTLAVTALLTGVALGAAGGGWAVERLPGAGTGFAVPAGAAALAAVVARTAGPGRRGPAAGRRPRRAARPAGGQVSGG